MHDGISFEQTGKPALVICTRPFLAPSRTISRTLGLPDFRFALVEHPIGSISPEQLAERARDAFKQGLDILTLS